MNNSDDDTTLASILGVNNPSIQYTDRPTAKALIFNYQNEVLIINDGLLPGGGIEEGEDTLAALHREVMEELGISIKDTQELGKVVQYRDFLQKKYSISGYTALYDGGSHQASPKDDGEAVFSYKWYSIHDALKLLDQSISQAKEVPVQTNDTYQGKLYNLETTKILLQMVQI